MVKWILRLVLDVLETARYAIGDGAEPTEDVELKAEVGDGDENVQCFPQFAVDPECKSEKKLDINCVRTIYCDLGANRECRCRVLGQHGFVPNGIMQVYCDSECAHIGLGISVGRRKTPEKGD